ncbi:Patellin-3 [Drechslerella dactyloides]|uniref:Patellin-3 n=1 Tax=Drechslerella dactyloides TaxID=74499 RepID=A0AAD6IZZ4_DREDA|nr:Patellin-3 [Drechslerella dactyloides]
MGAAKIGQIQRGSASLASASRAFEQQAGLVGSLLGVYGVGHNPAHHDNLLGIAEVLVGYVTLLLEEICKIVDAVVQVLRDLAGLLKFLELEYGPTGEEPIANLLVLSARGLFELALRCAGSRPRGVRHQSVEPAPKPSVSSNEDVSRNRHDDGSSVHIEHVAGILSGPLGGLGGRALARPGLGAYFGLELGLHFLLEGEEGLEIELEVLAHLHAVALPFDEQLVGVDGVQAQHALQLDHDVVGQVAKLVGEGLGVRHDRGRGLQMWWLTSYAPSTGKRANASRLPATRHEKFNLPPPTGTCTRWAGQSRTDWDVGGFGREETGFGQQVRLAGGFRLAVSTARETHKGEPAIKGGPQLLSSSRPSNRLSSIPPCCVYTSAASSPKTAPSTRPRSIDCTSAMASLAVEHPVANDLPETMSEKTMPIESTPVPEPTAPVAPAAPAPEPEPTAPVADSAPPAPEPVPKDDAPQPLPKDVPETTAAPAETPSETAPPAAAPAETAAAPEAVVPAENTTSAAPPPPIEKEPPTKPLPDLPPTSTAAAAPSSATPTRSYRIAEDEPGNTKSVPYASPDASAVPPSPTELTPEQSAKYDELLSLCKAITDVPIAKSNAERKPLSDSERMFMTKECLLRYLRATKWHVSDARKRIEGTITWRREWGLEDHTPEHIEPENETGKQVLFGFDKETRPCLYLNPARQNTERSDRQIQHLTFMLERVLDIAPAGSETLALLIDFKAASSGQNASLNQGRQVMDILQMHYPERLGRALIVNIPWWASLFLKAITPFIDPVTRPKLKYNEDMSLHVPKSHLLKEFKGDVDFTYDHATYWPNFVELCTERRRRYEERWRANGSQIGESEFYLKGGEKSKPLPTGDVEKVAEGMQNFTVQ